VIAAVIDNDAKTLTNFSEVSDDVRFVEVVGEGIQRESEIAATSSRMPKIRSYASKPSH
jgi:hypothetical protein